ncbi:hypothetical protein V1Y59_01280 [Gordonia sp. PKS22-38]|uniref:Uncharacterized protein n=1 Tax=Gordonia prachuapensis TaxID=3115651 RepID=A0ABU7MPB9_9ACTN|nr:hypothetical protein [Gordonia sp. PKS22-38]
MSPVSKKRRPKKKRGTDTRQRRHDPVDDHIRALGHAMRALRGEVDPLRSEAYASQLVSALTTRDEHDEDEAVVLGFLDTLADQNGPDYLALARAMSAVAPTARSRHAAAQAAELISGRGATEPSWNAYLGRASPLDTYEYADVFGDESTVMCTFTGPEEPHALVGFVNLSHRGGFFTDIVLTTSIDKAIAGFERYAAESNGLARFDSVPSSAASAVLAPALTESYRCVDVPEGVRELRALLGARLATLKRSELGMSANHRTGDNPQTDDAMAVLIADAPRIQAAVLQAWRDFGDEYDAGRTARLSPSKIRAFAQTVAVSDSDAAAALRSVLALQDQWSVTRMSPQVRAIVEAVIDETFPAPSGFSVDTSWIDELSEP